MRRICNFIMMTLFFFANTGCTVENSNNKENLFNGIYEGCEMNAPLKLSFQKVDFSSMSNVDVFIENMSDNDFVFSYKSGVKMWVFENSIWNERLSSIKIHDYSVDTTVLGAKNYKVIPIFPSGNNNEVIRVAVKGNFYSNGVQEAKCSGVFADYVITP